MISILTRSPMLLFIFIGQQKVDIIQTIHQAMLFIAVNLERFTLSCCFVGYCLFGQVYLYFCFRVRVDRVEQFFQKPSLTTTGKTKLFSSLFLWISAKKLETTTRKPYPAIAHAACSRLDPEPKFFRSQGFPPINGVIQYEIFI